MARSAFLTSTRRWLRVLLASAGAVLVLVAGSRARGLAETADFAGVLWLWVVGVLLFLAAFDLPETIRDVLQPLQRMDRRRWLEFSLLVALAVGSLVVRAIDLEHIPLNVGGDEGTWGVEGLAMLEGGRMANPFSTRWFAFPSMSFLAWGVAMQVFGETIAGLRSLSVLLGAASIVTTFLLARELFGRRIGWLATILLACSHYHIHYSRLAYNNIADDLFITLSLWLLLRGLRTERTGYYALAGAVMGLGWYGYTGARLIGLVAGVYLAHQLWGERRWDARRWQHLVLLAGAALVVAAPLLLHYAGHPDTFDARSQQVSVFASGWLEREVVITGRSAGRLMLEQFWKSISAFNYTRDPTFIYRPGFPLLDLVSGIFFVAGLMWSTAHWRRLSSGLLLTWFWSAIIFGLTITENPPASQRVVIVAPAVCLLAALGLNWLAGVSRRLFDGGTQLWRGAVGVVLVLVVALNLRFYFLVYTPTRVYGNPTAEIATELARHLQERGDDRPLYFYGPPHMYWDFGTLRFMVPDVQGVDVPPRDSGQAVDLDVSQGAWFVFVPQRIGELDAVRTEYPGGDEEHVYSTADGHLVYVMYQVGPQP